MSTMSNTCTRRISDMDGFSREAHLLVSLANIINIILFPLVNCDGLNYFLVTFINNWFGRNYVLKFQHTFCLFILY